MTMPEAQQAGDPPTVLITGFSDCLDTEDAFRFWFDRYAERGILPKVS